MGLRYICSSRKNTILEKSNFVDQIRIFCRSGHGGAGNKHFMRNKFTAMGGPDGGDGGRGAHIILKGNSNLWTLLHLRYYKNVLADVGLVGFPNAGKSTLLSVITAAKPKIANYAFTTLAPNLGMVEYRDGKSFCIADLPGIIEGAAEGKGLGHRFLRHIERNSVLLFLIPADSDDHKKEFDILLHELEKYNPELLHKQFIIAISKSDLLDEELKAAIEKELPGNIPHLFISSVVNKGITELKDLLWNTLNAPAA